MKPNQYLFSKVAENAALIMNPYGFSAHPIYDDGWDKHNEQYTASLIQQDLSEHIDQFSTVYRPKFREFRFELTRCVNTVGVSKVEEMDFSVADWTDQFLYIPHEVYTLLSGNSYNPFSQKLGFKVRDLSKADVEGEATKVTKNFERNLTFLTKALDGTYKGAMVDVKAYDIKRP